ncbi:hypothetical protein NitYY0826_C0747 [Nitratiruptor sp. YY08-26]|uniref:hypothetical protein n=1 Tax=unclassified Nitratiruptor TaxID=2624044 RepID=UPI00191543B0|nr:MULTISPECIES: hypothetical protein [unclassified Nitratiruptor]BCD61884.1 hypothetical protein NitYY0813_C0745 [Nitratiruptor sp. YY08-13]BCD65819.1 hypothetical protein NitYY0826_C0747 [Nitratiruptor sp. YY08-26]
MSDKLLRTLKKHKKDLQEGASIDGLIEEIALLQKEIEKCSDNELQSVRELIEEIVKLVEQEKKEILQYIEIEEKKEKTLASYAKSFRC